MFCVFPLCCCLLVSNSVIDCLERLVIEMTHNVLSGTLNPTLTHSLADSELVLSFLMLFMAFILLFSLSVTTFDTLICMYPRNPVYCGVSLQLCRLSEDLIFRQGEKDGPLTFSD